MPLVYSLVLLAVLAFWAMGAHNRLVRLRYAIVQAFGPLDAQLRRRYELAARMVDACREAGDGVPRESLAATLAACMQAQVAAGVLRGQPAHAPAAAALDLADGVLEGSLAQLLQTSGCLAAFAGEADSTAHALQFAQDAFNEKVAAYNGAVAQFPAVLLARLLGMQPAGPLACGARPQPDRSPHAAS